MLESFQKNGGEILFEHEVTDLAQDNTITQLTVLDKKTQQTQYLQAQYIVAADGSHSKLRQLLTIPMIGPATISTNVSVFCEIDSNNIIDKDKRFNIAHIIRQDGPMPLVLSVDSKKQWVFIFPSTGSNVAALKSIYTDDYVKNKIYKIIGNKTVDIHIVSKQVWPLGSQIANQFTAGRILFVGDSIHQFSPTGGMGMNTRLDDADNLMWKLAYVIQGKTHPDILNSYVIERLSIILTNMDWSLKNLHRIIKIRQLLSKQDIDKIDIQPIIQPQQAHLDKSGLDLGVIYESDYIMKSDIDMPIISANNYQPTTYPGSRLPHFELIRNSTTISSLDLISTEFVMLCETNAVSHAKQSGFKTIITRIIAIDDTNNTYADSSNKCNT